tara:strand:+ start:129 stop:380 length:252 start_codon:yes stop_codon:yes gene_type:complete
MISFENILNNGLGSIIISIILGLGLASLFKKVCKNDCIIIKVPNYKKIKDKIYEWDNECYKYDKINIACTKKNNEYIKEELEK